MICNQRFTLFWMPNLKLKSWIDSIQGMFSYILEKLTERKNGTKPKKTDSVPKKVINSLKKFVETLVPKKYFNRKMTLTKMTEQLLSQAHFSNKRRFRNRKKYLDIFKSIENYEESEEWNEIWKKNFSSKFCHGIKKEIKRIRSENTSVLFLFS